MSEWLKWGGCKEALKGGKVPKKGPLWLCPFSALGSTAPALRGESTQLGTLRASLPFGCHHCSRHTVLGAAGLIDLLPLKHALPIPHPGRVLMALSVSQNGPTGDHKREPHMMNDL